MSLLSYEVSSEMLMILFTLKKGHDVVELDLIGSDDVDGHNHLVISD